MAPKDIAYAVGIFLTFGLGVWNLLVGLKSSRRASFINTVTSQRIKWIEQLRQDLGAFSGLVYTWYFSCLQGKPQEYEVVKEIDRLRYVIRLRLNPAGIHDGRIEELLDRIPALTGSALSDPMKDALDDLMTTSQKLLKEEWEKVKSEAERGNLTKVKR